MKKVNCLAVTLTLILVGVFSSCRDCKDCKEYDDNKDLIGSQTICGDDLKSAEKDTAHFECQ